MKIKYIYCLLISILLCNLALSEEIECTQFKKLSAKYIECNAKKLKFKTDQKANELKVKTNQKANELKLKTEEKVEIGKEKIENSGVKDKLKKFKSSKTLSDLIKG